MLNHKIKRKWIAALRGTNYEQCTGTYRCSFKGQNKFCAMGVLFEVMGLSYPYDVAEIHTKNIDLSEFQSKITWMNDGSHTFSIPSKNFNQIADWIEENL
jgi:hypothetical protein